MINVVFFAALRETLNCNEMQLDVRFNYYVTPKLGK